jgi:hypothetical protein
MAQHLIMILVDSDSTKKHVKELTKGYELAGLKHSTEVVPLTSPEYTEEEQDYIGDMIAEMQEELSE